MSVLDSMSERYQEIIEDREAEIDRLTAELDALDRSHKDLAHRLAAMGRERDRLRTALEELILRQDIGGDANQIVSAWEKARAALANEQDK